MNLKDYRPDITDFNGDDDQPDKTVKETDSSYHEDVYTRKIKKLSNRVTIISIILPCLVSGIILFGYLDMKEKVVDADLSKQNQFEKISQKLEEQLNALDVKVAKNQFDLDSTLPELDQKTLALEGRIAKLTTSKADSATINDRLAKLDTKVSSDMSQNKTALQSIEKINKEILSSQAGIQSGVDKNIQQMKDEILAFKKGIDSKLAGFGNHEQQLGELRKDLSLLDKKLKKTEQDSITQAGLDENIKQLKQELAAGTLRIDKQVQALDQKMTANLSRLQRDIDILTKAGSSGTSKGPAPEITKPKPQINIDSSGPATIQQKPLTE